MSNQNRKTRMTYRYLMAASIAWMMTSGMANAEDRWYAHLNGDTLRVGNTRMERIMLWNGGNTITIGLTDKQAGFTLKAKEEAEPDFTIIRGKAVEGRLTVETVPSDGVHREYMDACVTFSIGTAQVKRHFRTYEDCPAIACDTRISGSVAEGDWDKDGTLEQLHLTGRHWQTRTVELTDRSDLNDNLVTEQDFIPMNGKQCRGNILFAHDMTDGHGFFFLKESPCTDMQLYYPGADFNLYAGYFAVRGSGVSPADIKPDHSTHAYTTVTGIYSGGEKEALLALHSYHRQQRHLMAEQDNMVMMNTWGERGEGRNISEAFCLEELKVGAEIGINVFQLDAGWESNYVDWKINPTKFPQGLGKVMECARQHGIRMALWFAPRWANDFAVWEDDAQKLIDLYNEYGISIFKIDGYNVPTKQAEENLFRMMERIAEKTHRKAILNMDETAGQRVGYFTTAKYGNIFMENRYTDWGNYYPFHTLRNLWQLSRYVPASRLQVEFLNPHRHPEKYAASDIFAPRNYSLPYLFAITMAGQPLAWLEAHNLTEEDRKVGDVIRAYTQVSNEFHSGTILPIGQEPDGKGWTGFQSILNDKEGFLIFYREDNQEPSHLVSTYLPAGAKVRLKAVTGSGKDTHATTDTNGALRVSLPQRNSFVMYRYQL